MSTIMHYDPFRETVSLRNAMDHLFEQSFVRPSAQRQTGQIPVDVYETAQGYQLRAVLPGVKPEDIELTAEKDTLTLKGQIRPWKQEEKNLHWLVRENPAGTFVRSITFPKQINAEQIETSYEYGVLTISVPVSEASRPRKITIGTAQTQQPAVEGSAN